LPPRFAVSVVEATVADLQAALSLGAITCVDIVRASLERIDRYDRQGPALGAMITVNPRALETASAMDRLRAAGAPLPPLHGMPLILKDNLDTADLPTTGGSITLRNMQPAADAFVVSRLREAGAIVIGKANLTELAYGGTSVSSLGGQTLNPYDLRRTPGGSSGGTGAAIAASYGVLGVGSDTGQSVRSPASACSLVGVRPTRGLVSRRGLMPFSPTQDEVGPITRTVEDAARMLDVMAGPDPLDPVTARGIGHVPASYTEALSARALAGARIGLLTPFLGTRQLHSPVNDVVRLAVSQLMRLGAMVMPIGVPGLDALTRDLSLMSLEFAEAFRTYLAGLGERAPVRTLAELVSAGQCHPSLRQGLQADARVVDGPRTPAYQVQLGRRDDLRAALLQTMDEQRLDAILYPHQRRLVAEVGEEQLERNGVLSNATGLPAVVFPGGFTPPSAEAPLGVPVGLELLGREWSEARLLSLAYAFERNTWSRQRPPGLDT
jgi:Asp-tRNA(Asn)/Glu-tRNA(Gln) amidotransferase A subunit family amidase